MYVLSHWAEQRSVITAALLCLSDPLTSPTSRAEPSVIDAPPSGEFGGIYLNNSKNQHTKTTSITVDDNIKNDQYYKPI